MSGEFQPGDVVTEVNDKKTMGVVRMGEHNGEVQVLCSWRDGKKRCEDWFPPAILKKVEVSGPPVVGGMLTRKPYLGE